MKLVAFRYALDVDYLDGFSDRFDSQYFEPFVLSRSDNKSFVDVGCFDGITSLRFAELCPDYRAIYAFELIPRILRFAQALWTFAGCRDPSLCTVRCCWPFCILLGWFSFLIRWPYGRLNVSTGGWMLSKSILLG